MKKRISVFIATLVFAFIAILSIESCKKEEDENPAPENPDVIIPETTKIFDEDTWNSIIEEVDNETYTFVFKEDPGLDVGDVLTTTAGYSGYLRKVTGISVSEGKTTVETEFATLEEAVENDLADVDNIPITFDLTSDSLWLADGVEIIENKSTLEDVHKIKIEKPLYDEDGNPDTEEDQIKLTGIFELEGEVVNFDYKISGFKLKHLEMGVELGEKMELTVSVGSILGFEDEEILVAEIPGTVFIVPAGIPISVQPVIELRAGGSCMASAELSTGISNELTYVASLSYRNSEVSYSDSIKSNELGGQVPSVSGSNKFEVYLKPVVKLQIFGDVASLSEENKIYGKAVAKMPEPFDLRWDLSYGAEASVVGKLDFFGSFFDVECTYTFFEFEKLYHSNPFASFDFTPETGATTETIFEFDPSNCSDEQDEKYELLVRWDWENDETWDTDFNSLNINYHSYDNNGAYEVKCQVKDSDGQLKDTIRIVTVGPYNNTPPNADFSVAPESGDLETVFQFDASTSFDNEDPLESLQVRWDFNGDGSWDSDWEVEKSAEHQYETSGTYSAKLEVKDTGGLTDEHTVDVEVTGGTGGWIPCPGTETVSYGGQTYNTVLIGDQCWLKENLNVGTMIPGENDMEDNGEIEKYCYDDDPENCETYGGLYAWDEMMQYVIEEGTQGICPPGWHVPTDAEWMILEGAADSYYGIGDPEWDDTGNRGIDVGYNLKSTYDWNDFINPGAGIDLYGFTALPGGWLNGSWGNHFDYRHKYSYFYTSTEGSDNAAWYRSFQYINQASYRYIDWPKDFGMSVRCLKND